LPGVSGGNGATANTSMDSLDSDVSATLMEDGKDVNTSAHHTGDALAGASQGFLNTTGQAQSAPHPGAGQTATQSGNNSNSRPGDALYSRQSSIAAAATTAVSYKQEHEKFGVELGRMALNDDVGGGGGGEGGDDGEESDLESLEALDKELNNFVLQHGQQFKCEMCGIVFRRRNLVLRHYRQAHLGLRPYACQHCPQKFKRPYALKRHVMQIHAKVRPEVCQHCGTGFVNIDKLRRHLGGYQDEGCYECM
jgi:hypothetical protein